MTFVPALVLGAAVASASPAAGAPKDDPVPDSVRSRLVVVHVRFLGDDGSPHEGELVCHRLAARDLAGLFDTLFKAGFPLRSVRPVSDFGGSDSLSMASDNSSAFNWRRVKGTRRLSAHALGLALDLNPWRNPFEHRNGNRPAGAVRDPRRPGTLSDTSLAVRYLRARGWWWGGRWASGRDWQHFELSPRAMAIRRAAEARPAGVVAASASKDSTAPVAR